MHRSFPARPTEAGIVSTMAAGLTASLITISMALAPVAHAATVSPSQPSTAASPSSSQTGSGSAPSTAKKSRATFGIAPITLGKGDARGYYSYQMGVGGSYTDKVAVLNYGAVPLSLSVFAADLGNADDGSIVVGLQSAALADAGAWVKLQKPVEVVTVPPTNIKTGVGRVVLPFTIQVPNNASPGDHGAALVAVLSTLGKNPKGENVRLDQRIATRMYVRVAGPLHPAMTIEGLKVTYQGTTNPIGRGKSTISYTLHNTGNVRLGAHQVLSVSGIFGAKTKSVSPSDVQLLFPGKKEQISVTVPGILPTVFEKAHLRVTPQLFTDQTPIPVPTASSAVSFYAVPWITLAIVLLLIVLAVVFLLRRRRRAKKSKLAKTPDSGGHTRKAAKARSHRRGSIAPKLNPETD